MVTNTVLSPNMRMSRAAQLFELICLYPAYVDRDVVPPGVAEEEWHLAFDSALAMVDDDAHDKGWDGWDFGGGIDDPKY